MFSILINYSKMNSQQLAIRQAELLKEIQALSISCSICHQTEEQKRCEIMIDSSNNSKCKKHICILCFKIHKKQTCLTCTKSIDDHHKKKNNQKQAIFEQAYKAYNREHAIRFNPDFQNLEFDLINLMAYYHAHPQVSVRKKYDQVEKQIKKILQSKNKEQRTLISEVSQVKKAKIDDKSINQTQSGVQSCGYNRKYQKGINLIRLSLGYCSLTPEQFAKNEHIIKNTSTSEENDQQTMAWKKKQLKLDQIMLIKHLEIKRNFTCEYNPLQLYQEYEELDQFQLNQQPILSQIKDNK